MITGWNRTLAQLDRFGHGRRVGQRADRSAADNRLEVCRSSIQPLTRCLLTQLQSISTGRDISNPISCSRPILRILWLPFFGSKSQRLVFAMIRWFLPWYHLLAYLSVDYRRSVVTAVSMTTDSGVGHGTSDSRRVGLSNQPNVRWNKRSGTK